jgi:hypothetical protein
MNCLELTLFVWVTNVCGESTVNKKKSIKHTCVPNLGLDCLALSLNAACGEFDSDGGLALQGELISCEARQKVGLSDTRIANQHNYSTHESSVTNPAHSRQVQANL